MKLNSDGFASSQNDPVNACTLERHCAERDLPYQDTGLPVLVETFTEYPLAFQRRFLPDLDTREVTTLGRSTNGYSLIPDDGEEVWAQRVVVATGTTNDSNIPPTTSEGQPALLSHSSQVTDENIISRVAAGKEIVIVGAGASAIDLPAMLCRSSVGDL